VTDKTSFIKARYCRVVLKTVSISPEQDARKLLLGLATEHPTLGTSPAVASAEAAALDALSEVGRKVAAGDLRVTAIDLTQARQTVQRWIEVAS
jgi:hypothetical protein